MDLCSEYVDAPGGQDIRPLYLGIPPNSSQLSQVNHSFAEEKKEKKVVGSQEDMPVGVFPTLVPPNASGKTELHNREIPPDVVTILLETFPRK